MSAPSQKARECKKLYDTTELDVHEAFDQITLELREALREATEELCDHSSNSHARLNGQRILALYSPEQEKG